MSYLVVLYAPCDLCGSTGDPVETLCCTTHGSATCWDHHPDLVCAIDVDLQGDGYDLGDTAQREAFALDLAAKLYDHKRVHDTFWRT